MNDLGEGTQGRGLIKGFLIGHHELGRHIHLLEERCATPGRALPETAPIVNDFESGTILGYKSNPQIIQWVFCDYHDPVREESAGGIEFLTTQDNALASRGNAGVVISNGLGLALG